MRRLSVLSLLALSGCTLAPDYQQPQQELPVSLAGAGDTGTAQPVQWEEWWTAFGDPELTALVERALAQNLDVREIAARVEQARAALGIARADFWPSLNGQAQASRRDLPDMQVLPGQDNPANAFSVSGVLNYELDLFGRVRSANEAARQDLLSTAYAYQSYRSAVAAQTAELYFNLIAARERLSLAERSVRTRSDALGVQEQRFSAGYSTELERQQAAAELADAQVLIPDLSQAVRLLESSLRVLTGAEPAELWAGDIDSPTALPEPPSVQLDLLPASLLERRPDIQAAEADLKAAYARVGVARAARWPTLSLSALIGGQSDDLEVFGSGAGTWSIGANLAGPIYDFGRSRNRARSAEAALEASEWRYRSVVLQAFQEVRDALTVREFSEQAVVARGQQARAFGRLLEVSQQQYEAGYTDQLQYLDAQRGELGARLALVNARLDRLVSTITLYRALGGGWTPGAAE